MSNTFKATKSPNNKAFMSLDDANGGGSLSAGVRLEKPLECSSPAGLVASITSLIPCKTRMRWSPSIDLWVCRWPKIRKRLQGTSGIDDELPPACDLSARELHNSGTSSQAAMRRFMLRVGPERRVAEIHAGPRRRKDYRRACRQTGRPQGYRF